MTDTTEIIKPISTVLTVLFGAAIPLFTHWLNHKNQLKQKYVELIKQKEINIIDNFNTAFWGNYYILKKYSSDITIPFEKLAYKRADIQKETLEAEKKYITSKSQFKLYFEENIKDYSEKIYRLFEEIRDLSVTAFIYKENTLNSPDINHAELYDDKEKTKEKLSEIETIYKEIEVVLKQRLKHNEP